MPCLTPNAESPHDSAAIVVQLAKGHRPITPLALSIVVARLDDGGRRRHGFGHLGQVDRNVHAPGSRSLGVQRRLGFHVTCSGSFRIAGK